MSSGVRRAARQDVGDQRGRVERGLGVGHGDERAVPTEGAGASARLDSLCFLASGFAQMRVQIHESGADPAALRVDLFGARRRDECLADLGDTPVLDHDVGDLTRCVSDDEPATKYK